MTPADRHPAAGGSSDGARDDMDGVDWHIVGEYDRLRNATNFALAEEAQAQVAYAAAWRRRRAAVADLKNWLRGYGAFREKYAAEIEDINARRGRIRARCFGPATAERP